MNEIFAGLRFANKKTQQTALVDFKSAWTLFPRNCPVCSFGLNVDIVGYHKYHPTKGLREYNDPSIKQTKATRRSAKAAYENVAFNVGDDENGQEAAPDEQTTAVKRRRLTDAEILENKNFMPEKQGIWRTYPDLLVGMH